VPGAALKILVGEFASALLEGQRAVPKKLLDSGFRFRFAELVPALRDVLAAA
jgi:NAD dependent epimerase/dehydratase family enzyme